MEITEAKIIAFLKDMERSCDVRFVTNNMIDPMDWHGDIVTRIIPKVRKVLKRMAEKGTVYQLQRGNSYRYKYVSPEQQAEDSARTARIKKEHVVVAQILDKSGMSKDEIEDIVRYSSVHMSFEQFFRFVNGIKKS